ncbi:MAG: site-specific DNA-methyltransferase [Bacteroidetes bacterium]|nr:MAG: site-specific DNA-methyltransferase [Bacteroidota bacterium]
MESKNKLFYGDNLENLQKYIKDETVDLCYIDPPFNSKRNYNQIYNNIGKEDKAQAQAFTDTWLWNTIANEGFEQIITNKNGVFTAQSINLIFGLEKVLGKGSLMAYLISMTLRIAEIYRVLKPTGCFYLHCDPTASHYLKLIVDAIFCAQGGDFLNEIVWHYNTGGKGKTTFLRKHDIIFWYSKSKTYIFNRDLVAVPRTVGTAHLRQGIDENGREYYEDYSPRKSGKQYRWYVDQGLTPMDVWTDIQAINPVAKERLGYPTQKPEALLERIIQASSNEGDVVLDIYCGCGTTISVAEKLKRNWIGIDITYQSISLIMKRLEDSFGRNVLEKERFTLTGVPRDMASAVALANKEDDRVRKEFEKWFVLSFSENRAIINEKKGGDGGIDGIAFVLDYKDETEIEEDLKQIFFSVKSNKTLSTNVIRDLYGTMQREKAVKGYLLTLYPMPNLKKEANRYGNYQNIMFKSGISPKIEVISVEELFAGEKMRLSTHEFSVLKKAKIKHDEASGKMFNA